MVETRRISAADGYGLSATVFGAERRGPVVVVNGASGVRQRYYAHFAQWLVERGATVVTYDYRGIGQSRPHRLKGFEGRMRDWGEHDFEGVLEHVERSYPGRELVVVGHSVGGQIIGMAPGNGAIARVATVAAQVGSWRLWPGASKWAFAGLWYGLMPGLTRVMGYFPGQLGIGADLPREVALEWARWCRHDDYFLGHGVSREGYERVRVPMLSISFSDDGYAPKPAVDQLHSIYSRAQVERVHLTPADLGAKAVGHFGAFREKFAATLWERLGAFVLGSPVPPRAASRPSADVH